MRSTYAHRLLVGSKSQRLRDAVRGAKVRGMFRLEIPAKFNRIGRTARLHVRTTQVVLHIVEAPTGERCALSVNVVDVREVHTVPRGHAPLHWRLLTNHPVTTDAQVEVDPYRETKKRVS